MAPAPEPRKTQSPREAAVRTTWANLDLELQLADMGRAPSVPPRVVLAVCDRWRHILRVLPELADARALARAERPPDDAVCWGVPPELAGRRGRPGRGAVRDANSKVTSHVLERLIGCALPGARVVRTRAGLARAIEATPGRWVAKDPLGVSARGRALGGPGEAPASQMRWAHAALARGPLVFEPWVDGRVERSWHADLGAGGEVGWRGSCEVLTDATGTPRGHVASAGERRAPPPELDVALAALAALGYHGPVGVDAMDGTLRGEPVRRPITEINARYTFGRIALELARHHAPAGAWIAWWHPKARAPADVSALEPLSPGAGEGVYRLPERADPAGASGTWVAVSTTREGLARHVPRPAI
jgi:hypothetical protein